MDIELTPTEKVWVETEAEDDVRNFGCTTGKDSQGGRPIGKIVCVRVRACKIKT
jgi:hypothetical protein